MSLYTFVKKDHALIVFILKCGRDKECPALLFFLSVFFFHIPTGFFIFRVLWTIWTSCSILNIWIKLQVEKRLLQYYFTANYINLNNIQFGLDELFLLSLVDIRQYSSSYINPLWFSLFNEKNILTLLLYSIFIWSL